MNNETLNNWLSTTDTQCHPSRPFLIVMCGLSGSGKSTASRFLAEKYHAAWVRSDVERKRLFGLPSDQSSDCLSESIYTPEATMATFQVMRTLADQLLAADYPVILDSCALKLSEREAFHKEGQKHRTPAMTVYCHAEMNTLMARVLKRQHLGNDPSEATADQISVQASWLETPSANEFPALIELDTEGAQWQEALYKAVKSIAGNHSDEA